MKLGAFSISLSVKDLAVSKTFYENLGFKVLAGESSIITSFILNIKIPPK